MRFKFCSFHSGEEIPLPKCIRKLPFTCRSPIVFGYRIRAGLVPSGTVVGAIFRCVSICSRREEHWVIRRDVFIWSPSFQVNDAHTFQSQGRLVCFLVSGDNCEITLKLLINRLSKVYLC